MAVKPQFLASFDMTPFSTGRPLPPLVDSSFAEVWSEGSSALRLTDELGFDPFMVFQLPWSDTYESIDSFFRGHANIHEDVTCLNNGMAGVSLWSFHDFPMDGAIV